MSKPWLSAFRRRCSEKAAWQDLRPLSGQEEVLAKKPLNK